MSEIKVNKISPRTACGTTTLGDSGDTFTIPAGVTITNSGTAAGFGATGAVSWDTTKITADPSPAVSGVGYFCDTSGAAFTVTLPLSPAAGAVVGISDYAETADTNNITLGRNSSNIEGNAADFVINQEGISITLVYVDATKGWITTDTGNSSNAYVNQHVTATGGSITCSGDYRIHTFTGPGTFCVSNAGTPAGSTTVDYMVVAGGGGASGGVNYTTTGGAGGGAGGYRESSGTASGSYTASPLGACVSALPVSVTGYPIDVGAGGVGVNTVTAGTGIASTFSTITSAGGGFGAAACGTGGNHIGGSGGSGGGAGSVGDPAAAAGAGNTPPVSPPQGNSGGALSPVPTQGPHYGGSGGGGSSATGGAQSPTGSPAGNGGAGSATSITGSPVTYASGGGAGVGPGGVAGTAGSGGGGAGSNSGNGNSGTINTGGGAGGANGTNTGGTGGSGVVIIRYKFQN